MLPPTPTPLPPPPPSLLPPPLPSTGVIWNILRGRIIVIVNLESFGTDLSNVLGMILSKEDGVVNYFVAFGERGWGGSWMVDYRGRPNGICMLLCRYHHILFCGTHGETGESNGGEKTELYNQPPWVVTSHRTATRSRTQ